MSNNLIQTAFAAGELSPTLYARVDVSKYHIGAALLENFYVDYRGGASTRSGTIFVGQTLASAAENVRLITFQFSVAQAYCLEFGPTYMRVIKEGAYVLEASKTITYITQSNPARVTFNTTGLVDGDQVYISNVVGMVQANARTVILQGVTGVDAAVTNLDGSPLNTTAFSPYVSGGTIAKVVTVVTPWADADIPSLKFTQSADVLTVTHPDYPPTDITRTSHTSWTVTTVSFGTNMNPPTSPTAAATSAGTAAYAYVITSVGTDGQESVASARVNLSSAVNIGATAGSITISWTAPVAGGTVDHYNVYKASPVATGTIPAGVSMGFMGSTAGVSIIDPNIVPDLTITPPLATNPFTGGNNPGTVGYFQQRKVYGGSNSEPETLWFSQVGAFKNFDVSNPITASDAITATLASTQVNNIKFMLAMPGGLITLTGGGAWQVSGGVSNSAITPSTITAVPQAYSGCADVQPLPINYNILYVQAKGNVVRNLEYNFYTNIYTGTDIGIMSNHLLENYNLNEWVYAEQPNKLIWAVRNDGTLLTLTYLKEQDVNGWAHHNTRGLFKSVAQVPEGDENKVYFVVERLINNNWVKYVEQLAPRSFDGYMNFGIEDAWFLDAALQSPLTYPATGIQISGVDGDVTVVADAPVFTALDAGKDLRVGGGIGSVLSVTDLTTITVRMIRPIERVLPQFEPVMPLPALDGEWSLTARNTSFSGLGHLEGETVTALGDGNVFPNLVVTNGTVVLPQPVSKVTIGIPYRAKLQSLRLDTGDPTIQGKRKKIPAVSLRVANTKGLKAGADFNHLTEVKVEQPRMGVSAELFTGDQRVVLDSIYNTEGQLCVQQDYPLPATVLGIIPEVVVGDQK